MSTSSTLTFPKYGKHGIGRRREGGRGEGLGRKGGGGEGGIHKKRFLLPVLVSLAAERRRKKDRKRVKRDRGTDKTP